MYGLLREKIAQWKKNLLTFLCFLFFDSVIYIPTYYHMYRKTRWNCDVCRFCCSRSLAEQQMSVSASLASKLMRGYMFVAHILLALRLFDVATPAKELLYAPYFCVQTSIGSHDHRVHAAKMLWAGVKAIKGCISYYVFSAFFFSSSDNTQKHFNIDSFAKLLEFDLACSLLDPIFSRPHNKLPPLLPVSETTKKDPTCSSESRWGNSIRSYPEDLLY